MYTTTLICLVGLIIIALVGLMPILACVLSSMISREEEAPDTQYHDEHDS